MTHDIKKCSVFLRCIEIGIISTFIFLLCIVYGGINYETNDDIAMNLIAAGAYGEPSQYLVFSGILWGYFIKILYSVFPAVNCYLWLYLILNLFSIILLCIALSERLDAVWTAAITIIVNIVFCKDVYVDIQFSKNAEIYAVIGTVLIISTIRKKEKYWGRVICGSIFLAIGSSVRLEGLIQVIPLAVVALIFVLAQNYSSLKKKKEIAKATKNTVAKIMVPVFTCFIVLATNFVAYDLNHDWKDYYQWNEIMSQKRDFGNYNFEWARDEYLSNGFTEWDFRLMEEWMWNDCDNYSLDKLKLMAEIGKDVKMNRLRFDTKLVGDTIDLIAEAGKESTLPIVFLIVLIISLFVIIRNKNWIGTACTLLIACGALLELYYLACMRRVPWRTEFGIWFTGIVFILTIAMEFIPVRSLSIRNIGKVKKKKLWIGSRILVLSLCVISLFIWQKDNLNYSAKSWENKDYSRYEYIKSINETDGLFVMSIHEMFGGLNGATNIWDINRTGYEGFYKNIIAVGGWVIPSPIGMYYAHENGISNVFKAFSERDDIYYIGGGETMGYLLVYQNEKYGPGISVTDVEFDWGTAWKFFRE